MICKYCGSDKMVKDGIVAGKQRYKCKECHKTMRKDADDYSDDKRNKYELWKKIALIREYMKGASIIKTANDFNTSYASGRNWIKNYETDIKKGLIAVPFPKDPKDIRLLKQRYLKLLRDERNFEVAFGIIVTDKGPIIFVMDNE